MVHGLGCSEACGIFLDEGLNPCFLHWQVDSSPLSHQGSPTDNSHSWLMFHAGIPSFFWFIYRYPQFLYSLVVQTVKSLPAMRETQVQSLGQEDPLEKEMATHSSILSWRIPWTEEPGGLESMGSQKVRHDWVTNTFTFFQTIALVSKSLGTLKSPCYYLFW